jgi:hypothetical protein
VDNVEAKTLLRSQLETYRRRKYAELAALMGDPQVAQLKGPSGVEYTIEIDTHWDNRTGGNVRVIGSIDDGGWRAFIPLCDSFIMSPDGTFIGE